MHGDFAETGRIEHAPEIKQAIDDVMSNGDALDVLKHPLGRYPAHNAIRAGSITTGIATSLFTANMIPELQHIGYGVIAAGAAEATRRVRNHRRAIKVEGRLEAQQSISESIREPLELIKPRGRRKKESQPILYWGAEFESDDTLPGDVRGRLEKVVEIAKAGDIEQVVVPSRVLDFIDDESYVDDMTDAKVQPISEWLGKTKKRLPVVQEDYQDDLEKDVLQLTLDECEDLINHIEARESDPIDPFRYAWEILKKERPTHSFLQKHANSFLNLVSPHSSANGDKERARQTLANLLAQRIDDTTVQRGPQFERVRIPLTARINKHSPKVNMHGTQVISTITGDERLQAEDSRELLSHLGIGKLDLVRFFTNSSRLSRDKRIEISEVVMLYKLSGWELPFETEENTKNDGPNPDQSDDEISHLPISLQQSTAIAAGITTKKQRRSFTEASLEAAGRIDLTKFGIRRAIRLAGTLALAATLATPIGSMIINAPANFLYERSIKEYIDELPTRDPSEILDRINSDGYSEYTMQDVEEFTRQAEEDGDIPYQLYNDFDSEHGDPINEAYAWAYNTDDQIADIINQFRGDAGVSINGQESEAQRDWDRVRDNSTSLNSASDPSVGNVDPGSGNKPLWLLESNGMNTSGYWSQSTHNLLYESEIGGSLYWSQDDEIYRMHSSDDAPETVQLMDAEQADQLEDYIRVSNVQPTTFGSQLIDADKAFHIIPVLNGTTPVAINVSAARMGSNISERIPASILQLSDGNYIAVVDSEFGPISNYSKMDITYWLAPIDENNPPKYGLTHAVAPIEGSAMFFEENDDHQEDYGLSRADDTVDSQLPNLPPGGKDRIETLANHIKSNFSYALAPLSEDAVDEVESIPDYVNLVFDTAAANCNVANTLLAVDSPEKLNSVTGYNNSTDPASPYDTLSLAEGHLWTVDSEGNIYDATPAGGISEEDAQFFAEDFTSEDFKREESQADKNAKRWRYANDGFKVLVGAAALSIAFRNRKHFVNAYVSSREAYVNRRGNIALKSIGKKVDKQPFDVRIAKETIEHILFGIGNKPTTLSSSDQLTLESLTANLRRNRGAKTMSGISDREYRREFKRDLQTSKKSGRISSVNRRQRRLARRLVKNEIHVSRVIDPTE